MKREVIQEKVLKDIYTEDNQIKVAEVRTGTGKTKLLLDLALMHTEAGRNVVISTANNFLVRSYFGEAVKFGYDTQIIKILIGRNNYVDKTIVTSKSFLKNYSLRVDKVEEWIRKNRRILLSDLFVRDFNLPEEAEMELSVTEDAEYTVSQRIRYITEDGGSIFVTNHHYIIYLLRYARKNNIPIPNTVFLFDEAHMLNDAAQSIFSNNFSLSHLRFGLHRILDDAAPTKTMKNRILSMSRRVEAIIPRVREAGEPSLSGTPRSIMEMLKELLNDEEMQRIVRFAKKCKSGGTGIFLREYMEGAVIFLGHGVDPGMVGLAFSTIRQYPSFSLSTFDGVFQLRDALSHPSSSMVFFSGTIRVSADEDIAANEWSFFKMGLFKYKKADTPYRLLFNERVDNIEFKVYPHIFNRNEVRFLCAKDNTLLPPRSPVGEKTGYKPSPQAYELWITHLARYFGEKVVGNAVCLMSSFENCEMMARFLRETLGDGYKIICHRRGRSMGETIDTYKKAIDDGHKAVLVGGLPFFTGIDLHGKYLTTLFVGKLPIEPKPSLTRRTPNSITSIQKDMRFKSLLLFRQGIGRAKRKNGDRVFIIVADPRINNRRYSHFRIFLDEIGLETFET